MTDNARKTIEMSRTLPRFRALIAIAVITIVAQLRNVTRAKHCAGFDSG